MPALGHGLVTIATFVHRIGRGPSVIPAAMDGPEKHVMYALKAGLEVTATPVQVAGPEKHVMYVR